VDLIEEVARLYGYDRIPTSLPWGQQQPGGRTEWQENRRTIRHTLRDLGLNEVITYSLTSESLEGEITYPLTVPHIPIPIAMPMSNEHAILRTNLLPQLVQVAAHNRNHGVPDISIYELSKVYLASDDNQHTLPEERFQLAFLLTGDYHPSSWIQAPQNGGDFFTAKGILTALLERLCITGIEYEAISIDGFHPGRTALLKYDKHVIGVLGQIHPSLSKKYDLDDTVVCQIDLENLLQLSSKDDLTYQPIPRYPGITRDLALIIDESLPVSQIEAGIRAVTGELLKKVTLFDVFTGEQIGTGKKSIAFNLVYRSDDRTLTDEEVQSVHDGAVAFLVDTFKAKLR
jgi:phenylalanyl-tRNA synthetase beta chain